MPDLHEDPGEQRGEDPLQWAGGRCPPGLDHLEEVPQVGAGGPTQRPALLLRPLPQHPGQPLHHVLEGVGHQAQEQAAGVLLLLPLRPGGLLLLPVLLGIAVLRHLLQDGEHQRDAQVAPLWDTETPGQWMVDGPCSYGPFSSQWPLKANIHPSILAHVHTHLTSTLLGGAGDRAINTPVTSQPALPPEPHTAPAQSVSGPSSIYLVVPKPFWHVIRFLGAINFFL